jgi:hypothetical protein
MCELIGYFGDLEKFWAPGSLRIVAQPLVSTVKKRRFFATTPFSHNTTRSDFIAGCGLLTDGRVRDITSSYQGTMARESMVRRKFHRSGKGVRQQQWSLAI